MPDVLLLKMDDFELLVWSKDISKQKHRLAESFYSRGESLPSSAVTFSQPTLLHRALSMDVPLVVGAEPSTEVTLQHPLFFVNTQYEFEFVFNADVASDDVIPQICHESIRINELFHYSCRHDIPTLRGNINFADHTGWFCLPVKYFKNGELRQLTLSFEVWPTSVDVMQVTEQGSFALEHIYPLWADVLTTELEANDQPLAHHGTYSYLWLSQFEFLRDKLEYAFTQVLNEPHSQLVTYSDKESDNHSNEMGNHRPRDMFRTDIKSGNINRRYQMAHKVLSVDTAENRFIKMVLTTTVEKLESFEHMAKLYQQLQRKLPLPHHFEQRLSLWIQPLTRLRDHTFFSEVGAFGGLAKQSTVLQKRKGYEQIYRHWHLLSLYLDVLGSLSSIEIQSVEHLYEVWCFLELKKMVSELGFVELESPDHGLTAKNFQLRAQQGFCGSFGFARDDGIRIRLAHERVFEFQSRSIDHKQATPTILLEARYSDGEQLHWLFDVSFDNDFNDEQLYDHSVAKLKQHLSVLKRIYTHPVQSERADYGAFVLYPKLFMQQRSANSSANPFYQNIVNEHVGAFPMLPRLEIDQDEVVDNNWLSHWLFSRFGIFEFDQEDDFDF